MLESKKSSQPQDTADKDVSAEKHREGLSEAICCPDLENVHKCVGVYVR
jgi:hypothetical protein